MTFNIDRELRNVESTNRGESLAARQAVRSEFLRLEAAAHVATAREKAALAALDAEVQRSVVSEAEETRLRAQLAAARFELESHACLVPSSTDSERA